LGGFSVMGRDIRQEKDRRKMQQMENDRKKTT
jgi:hypothetical protein